MKTTSNSHSFYAFLMLLLTMSFFVSNADAQTFETPPCYGYEECGTDDADWSPWAMKTVTVEWGMFP